MQTIGARIAFWRVRRGKSQRVLAGLAGISQPYLANIERGHRALDRRHTLVALADALEVSVQELTEQPGDPIDPAHIRAAQYAPAIREALLMRDAGEVADRPADPALADALQARARFDFVAAAELLPRLLASATGPDLVQACAVAITVLGRATRDNDLAVQAARLGLTAAQETDDPAWIGTAQRLRAHAIPHGSVAALPIAIKAADDLQPKTGEPRTRRAYGMLHLEAALRCAVVGRAGDADDHLREADEVAAGLGEPDQWDDLAQNCFGPTNVAMWRMTAATELGDPDRALHLAGEVQADRIPFVHRRAAWLVDHMTALAGARKDSEAVAAFLQAESLCPQFVRLRPVARDTIGVIWRRARRESVPPPLRRAAAVVGWRD